MVSKHARLALAADGGAEHAFLCPVHRPDEADLPDDAGPDALGAGVDVGKDGLGDLVLGFFGEARRVQIVDVVARPHDDVDTRAFRDAPQQGRIAPDADGGELDEGPSAMGVILPHGGDGVLLAHHLQRGLEAVAVAPGLVGVRGSERRMPAGAKGFRLESEAVARLQFGGDGEEVDLQMLVHQCGAEFGRRDGPAYRDDLAFVGVGHGRSS